MTSKRTYLIVVAILVSIISTLSVLGRGHNSNKPPASEFGPGPRLSANGLYTATLQGATELKPRKMHTIQATVVDASGHAVTNATIDVGGGMPQHGHGFPTNPRVTKNLGSGMYEISGLRFNMGGWWELKLTITTAAGTDTVTFNLAL